ncbi:MAG: hypothetical protein EBV03_01630 [Proteobacteria bacterium]|nr:hypothetical protein [Pseudomonadota bacterium]
MTNNETFEITPDNVARAVTMIFGKSGAGTPFWCFITVKPTALKTVQERAKSKTLNLLTYESDGFGEIIVSGDGVVPPKEVLKTVASMFNVPLRKMFDSFDMDDVVQKEIQSLKKQLGVE